MIRSVEFTDMSTEKPGLSDLETLNIRFPVEIVISNEWRSLVTEHSNQIQWGSVIEDLDKYETQTFLGLIAQAAIIARKWVSIELNNEAIKIAQDDDLIEAHISMDLGIPIITDAAGYSDGVDKLVRRGLALVARSGSALVLKPTEQGILEIKKQLTKEKCDRLNYNFKHEDERRPIRRDDSLHEILTKSMPELRETIKNAQFKSRLVQSKINQLATSHPSELEKIILNLRSRDNINRVLATYTLKEALPDETEDTYNLILDGIVNALSNEQIVENSQKSYEECQTAIGSIAAAHVRYDELKEQRPFLDFLNMDFAAKLRDLSLKRDSAMEAERFLNLHLPKAYEADKWNKVVVDNQQKLKKSLESIQVFVKAVEEEYKKRFK